MGVHSGDAGWHSGRRRCGLRDPVPPGAQTGEMTRQFLIVDADDTLWENNIYFERAFEEFVAFLAHSSMPVQAVRDVLDDIERANARIHGYGSLNFGRNLAETYRHLTDRAVSEDDVRTVMR